MYSTTAKISILLPGVRICELPLNRIVPNEKQARKNFDSASIHELAHSIQREGLLQPIIVCPMDGEKFSIVAGERRFRAMQFLGAEKILAKIIHADGRDCAIISLIENLQRESLNPVEEAAGFAQLATEYGFTQEQIAQRVGKARATIANSMRLLNLEEKILSYLALGKTTVDKKLVWDNRYNAGDPPEKEVKDKDGNPITATTFKDVKKAQPGMLLKQVK